MARIRRQDTASTSQATHQSSRPSRGVTREDISPPPPVNGLRRFTTVENEQWYQDHRRCKLIVEKTVAPSLDSMYHLHAAFRKLGWEPILRLSGTYYPDLVQEFYANIQDKEKKDLQYLVTHVKGREIHVSPESLSTLFGFSSRGAVFKKSKKEVIDANWNYTESRFRLNVHYVEMPSGHTRLLCKQLDIRPRLLVHLLAFNVQPRASNLNELRLGDIYFVDQMLHDLHDGFEGIPLAPIILTEMREVVRFQMRHKALIFPLLITKILAHAGVDFAGEEAFTTTTSDVLDDSSMLSLGYTWDKKNAVWFRDVDPSMPLDDNTSDASASESAGPSSSTSRPRHHRSILSHLTQLVTQCQQSLDVIQAEQQAIRTELAAQRSLLERFLPRED